MGKQKGCEDVLWLTSRPVRRASVAEQVWGADVNHEFLRLIKE